MNTNYKLAILHAKSTAPKGQPHDRQHHDAVYGHPNRWRPISTVPISEEPVRLLLESGRELTASKRPGFTDCNGHDCWLWVCSDEDNYPECWTDGACWERNAADQRSDQPTHWQSLADWAEALKFRNEEVRR